MISPKTVIDFGKYKNYTFEDIYLINSHYCQWIINQHSYSKRFKKLQEYLVDREYYLEEYYKNRRKCYNCKRYLTYKKKKIIYETSFEYSQKTIKDIEKLLLGKVKEIGIVNNIIELLCICKFCKKIKNNDKIQKSFSLSNFYLNANNLFITKDKCTCNHHLVYDFTNKYSHHIENKYCLNCNKIYFYYVRYPTKKLLLVNIP